MSYEYERLTDMSPIVVDVESAPLWNARDFIEAPDLAEIAAPANYKDPQKIAAYIEQAKADEIAKFERACAEKAALDFNCARIVAIGWWTETTGTRTRVFDSADEEAAAIQAFWAEARQRLIVGFCVRTFDLPMLVQRSRYLGVPYPSLDLGRYARHGAIVDLFDLLTFNDLRTDAVMRRTVKAFAKRFGIAVTDTINGADIPGLVAAGEWDKVSAHVASDVEIEVALARKLGVVRVAEQAGVL